ncbi:hypothetical protein [Curtobacterium sp. P97]|uniref:hypothetical protein n=1 Tax=Curtobacterium sp. P97 TaxID=2939562 RepID=UPI00203F095E|nr:hypothetical protein [Curtobacterium sp. P97]MCM3521740.1 hypothetical protein [Curtobacterium sp. P97]
MHYIEIQTAENSRLIGWVRIYGDSDLDRLLRWGSSLLDGVHPKPSLRVTDSEGVVAGAWQKDGYTA